MLSLGMADTDSALVSMSKKEISNLLIHKNTSKPSDFDFKIMDFENQLTVG